MMIEPLLAVTGISAAANIVLAAMVRGRDRLHARTLAHIDDLYDKLAKKDLEIFALRTAENDRKARLSVAGKMGRAAQIAKAAQPDPARDAAREKTVAALANMTIRSRAQIVAPVKAARTRKKNTAAGVAAK